MNTVFATNLLKGLEAIAKVNKTSGKALNINDVTVKVDGNNMTLNSVNLDCQVIFTLPVQDAEENCFGIMDVEKMVKALKRFNTYTSIDFSNNIVTVSDGKKSIKLAETIQHEKQNISSNKPFTVDYNTLFNAFKKVKKSVATEEIRPILTGIHFKNNFIESCDGYRISQVNIINEKFTHDFTIKPFELELILNTIKKDKLDVSIDLYNSRCILMAECKDYSIKVVSKVLDGEFLKTENILSETENYNYKLLFNNSKELIGETEFIADMNNTDNKKYPIVLTLDDRYNTLTIQNAAKDTQTSVTANNIQYENDADSFTIGFNPYYMLDAIKSIDGSFTMQFTTPLKPCFIMNDNERYMILPIKINA